MENSHFMYVSQQKTNRNYDDRFDEHFWEIKWPFPFECMFDVVFNGIFSLMMGSLDVTDERRKNLKVEWIVISVRVCVIIQNFPIIYQIL